MILQRQHYAELPWWRWAHLRATLALARMTGGFGRSLGIERAVRLNTSLNPHSHRVIPEITTKKIEVELAAAEAICPTGAIKHSGKGGWKIKESRCISCGLCYPCAPQSLAPSASSGSLLSPSLHKIEDFAKIL